MPHLRGDLIVLRCLLGFLVCVELRCRSGGVLGAGMEAIIIMPLLQALRAHFAGMRQCSCKNNYVWV